MSTLDIGIILFVIFWGVRGFFKGFASEIISLLVWVSAFYLSIKYFHIPSGMINDYISSAQVSSIITVISIFVITFLIAAILGFISSKLINFIGLYNYNKILGLLFGSIKGLVFLSFFTYIIYQTDSQNYYMLKESEFMPIFKDFLDKYTQRGNSLFDSLELKI
ncbi:MAG: CvpA family protein [Gammaproteobacteria bacterium]|jgi:membrane protein required for colicin V production|nr:CvpA family protein [Gammaproteobacteria bacterium]MBT4461873.1 CvpA family protein [Gammaproteobacteria bacterium]MBT4654262.1 CvpA family protein [Gammaproteobacteria bacterium]MBT5116288.1 CvpA family protein [Gammaproteobacteria bacterium]MBT5761167.1 CvpA family protein [Gammaproteobacteria bacterium]